MNREILSQLADGELSALEIESALDQLLADPELQRAWQTLHAVRAGVRAEGLNLSTNITDKISTLLEQEPDIMAPNNIVSARDEVLGSDNIVAVNDKRSKGWAFTAIAASVAALVMLGYSPKGRQMTPIIAQAGINASQTSIDTELQSMIVQHGEFSGATALNGLAAYAKVVNRSTTKYAR